MNPNCIECRDTGITRRGICPKCESGPNFVKHRTDGGALLMWRNPELAQAVLGAKPPRREHPDRDEPAPQRPSADQPPTARERHLEEELAKARAELAALHSQARPNQR